MATAEIRTFVNIRNSGYRNVSAWFARRKKIKHLEVVIAAPSGCTGCIAPACLAPWVSPLLALAVLKPPRSVWVGHSPLRSPLRVEFVASIWSWSDFIHVILKNVQISKRNLLFVYIFSWNFCPPPPPRVWVSGGSGVAAALTDKPPVFPFYMVSRPRRSQYMKR